MLERYRMSHCAAWLCLTVFVLNLPPLSAQEPNTQPPSLFQLVFEERYNEARRVLKQRPYSSVDQLFLEGLINKRKGNLKRAEGIFRDILKQAPDFVPAKGELAHTLLLLGKHRSAQYHFEHLRSSAESPTERQRYAGYIRAISSRKPYGVSGYIGMLTSSNINKGSSQSIFDTQFGTFQIDQDGREQSGDGLNLGANGFYRWSVGEQQTKLILNSALGSNIYENSRFNFYTLGSSLHIQKRHGKGQLLFGPSLSFGFDQERLRYRRIGPEVYGTYQLSPKQQLSFNLKVQRQSYTQSQLRNGYLTNAKLSLHRALSPSTRYKLGVEFVREQTQRDALKHTDDFVIAEFEKQFKRGFFGGVTARYGERHYDGVFTGLQTARRDRVASVSLAAVYPKLSFKGFAPKLRYTLINQQSNVAFYDYVSHDVSLLVTRQF